MNTTPKNRSRANRGKKLEADVIRSCLYLARSDLACVQKIAVPSGTTRDGQFFRRRSTVDFIGVIAGTPVAFDAKELAGPRLSFAKIPEHQIGFLLAFERAQGVGFFLVRFGGGELFAISATMMRELSVLPSVTAARLGVLEAGSTPYVLRLHPKTPLCPVPLDQVVGLRP